jgi:peptidoglycan-N-acetylglucosamine deacetylase
MKIILAVAAAAAFLGSAVISLPKAAVGVLRSTGTSVLYSVETDQPRVSLTIDDGPSEATPEILAVLEEHHVRATFFLIGKHVEQYPEHARTIVERGHEVAHHMMADEPSIKLSEQEFLASFTQMDSILQDLGGARFFRPGSGWYNDRMIRAAEQFGYRVVLGSVYPFDAQLPYPSMAAWYVTENTEPGSIIVLHDGAERGRRTAEVLRHVLPELKRRGLQVMRLSDLISTSEPR